MIRSARLGLLTALSFPLLALVGCSSTPTDSEPVVIARTTPSPATPHRTTTDAPRPAPLAATTDPDVAETPIPLAPGDVPTADARPVLNSEDLLFLSYITEFTLMERPESDQIRFGLALCNSLYRGQSKPELMAAYVGDDGYTRAEVANVMTAATVAYCPDFA